MKTPIATSLIALSTAIAAPAMADVTAADVWSNQQNLYKSVGVTLSGDLADGLLNNPEMNIVLPQGIASLQIRADAVIMAANGDGTVTISYPSPMTISVAGGVPNEGSFEAELSMTHEGYSVIASGNPGDVTYVTDVQNLRVEPVSVSTDGMGDMNIDLDGQMTISTWTGTTNVSEGNMINYTVDSSIGETVAEFIFTSGNVVSTSKQTNQPIQSTIEAMLPVGGADVMNLSAALRDGLSFAFQSAGDGSSSVSEATLNGEVMNSQTTTTGPQTASGSFDENGFVASADATAFGMSFFDPLIFPGNLDFSMDRVTADYDIPVNAAEDAQDFRIATSLQGLTLGDTIWSLFDPSGQLPRDPAEVSFDVTGMGTNGTDLLDIAGLMQLSGPPDIEINEVTIENLRIAAVGAEATAKGAMTFDWTDMMTIPGIARPEGQVTVNLNGANALMDRLVAMGLIPEEDLMMPRMMMGMFATPVGDDALESVLEINSEGHVLANGQRLR